MHHGAAIPPRLIGLGAACLFSLLAEGAAPDWSAKLVQPPASRLESTPGPPPGGPQGRDRERGSYRTLTPPVQPRRSNHRSAV